MKRDASASRTRVCLLWKHPLVLQEVKRVLEGAPYELLPVRIEASSAPSPASHLPPDTVLHLIECDASGPRTATLVTHLLSANPSARPIVMGDEIADETAFTLLRLGTKGIATYAEVSERLPRVLQEVIAGGFWVPRALLSRFVDATRVEGAPRRPSGRTPVLTPREREVLDDLLQNLSNKEIARKRRISARTAKFHVSNVLVKFGVRRRADLLLLSYPERSASPSS